jgi:hypothetical protein
MATQKFLPQVLALLQVRQLACLFKATVLTGLSDKKGLTIWEIVL